MNFLVIYDSVHGNTKAIADTIAKEMGSARIVLVSEFKPEYLKEVELLVVGSPIIAWQPTVSMAGFLAGLKEKQLSGVKAAAFDTRVELFIHGDAAGKIAAELSRAGAQVVAEPVGFKVKGKAGPLKKGELEKAAAWARMLKASAV